MSNHFSATLRSIERDSVFGSLWWLPVVFSWLLIWAYWFFLSSLPVYVVSEEARLQVEGDGVGLEAEEVGRIAELHVAQGEDVAAGATLLALEAEEAEQLHLEEMRLHAGLTEELVRLERVAAAAKRAASQSQASFQSLVDRADSEQRATRAVFEAALKEQERSNRLRREGLISAQQFQDVQTRVLQLEAELAAASSDRSHARSELVRDGLERQMGLEEVARQVAEAKSRAAASAAKASSLRARLDRRFIKAPVSGRIAELVPLVPGTIVQPGDRLGTLIPASELRVVARFRPSGAAGRLREGQVGQMRFDGFPWVEFGAAEVRVGRVDGESRDGLWRAELILSDPPSIPFALIHGLPGTALVQIEQVSPANLLLRAIGISRFGLDSESSPRLHQ